MLRRATSHSMGNEQGPLGQYWTHLGLVGPRRAPYWPHKPCYRKYIARRHPLDGDNDTSPPLPCGRQRWMHQVLTITQLQRLMQLHPSPSTEPSGPRLQLRLSLMLTPRVKSSTNNQVPQHPVNWCLVQRQEHRERIRGATKSSSVVEGSRLHSNLECG